jgi:hypothetical protein
VSPEFVIVRDPMRAVFTVGPNAASRIQRGDNHSEVSTSTDNTTAYALPDMTRPSCRVRPRRSDLAPPNRKLIPVRAPVNLSDASSSGGRASP